MWREPALDSMRNMRAFGLNDFDVIVVPGHLWPTELSAADRRQLANSLQTEDIRIESLNLPALDLNLASCIPEVRAYSVGVFQENLRLSMELGGNGVVVVPGRVSSLLPPQFSDVINWLVDSMERVLKSADETAQTIFMECIPSRRFPPSI